MTVESLMDDEKRGGPLSGFRIIDLSTVYMGPFATQFLADHGAEVIKVESPEGDISRGVAVSPEAGMSAVFNHLNRGKRSIVLDLKRDEGRAVLRELLKDAHALVYNMRSDALKRLGLGYDDLKDQFPGLVHVALVGYGSAGPYAGRAAYDDLIQGLSGIAVLNARATGRAPVYAPMALADRLVGLYGCIAILLALTQAGKTGRGTAVEVPMFECMTHFSMVEHLYYQSFMPATGDIGNARALSRNRKPYPSKDGYICVMPVMDKHWVSLFELIGRHDLIGDPRFDTLTRRTANTDVLYEILEQSLAAKTTEEWLHLLQEADIPACRMNTLEDLLTDPHLQAVKFFQPTYDEQTGGFQYLRNPISWKDGFDGSAGRAPRLGQDTREILASRGYAPDEVETLISRGVAG